VKKVEYYLKRIDDTHFNIAKFGEASGDQPENEYHVQWNQGKDDMHCDCPNRRKGRGVNDKHGAMVRSWLSLGEPVGFFDNEGVFHARPELDNQSSPIDPDLERLEQWDAERDTEADLDGEGSEDGGGPEDGDPFGLDEGEHR